MVSCTFHIKFDYLRHIVDGNKVYNRPKMGACVLTRMLLKSKSITLDGQL